MTICATLEPSYEKAMKLMLKASDYSNAGEIKRHFRINARLKAHLQVYTRHWQLGLRHK